jgi:chemotaxis protein MotB
MSRKKKHASHGEEEGGEAWLLPYSDLMTLLLAVFIVLFAVSQVNEEKAQMMSEAFTDQMMTQRYADAKVTAEGQTPTNITGGAITEEQQMEKLKEELDAKLKSENLTASVTTRIDERGLVVSLSNAIIFDPGSAEIKKENVNVLLEIANTVSIMSNYIRIEGHTDNVPMNSSQYPSNWDLSVARAANVVRLLTTASKITPDRLIAVGYGEYRPVADNSTEEGRAKNRRIDIIVMSSEYNQMEETTKD